MDGADLGEVVTNRAMVTGAARHPVASLRAVAVLALFLVLVGCSAEEDVARPSSEFALTRAVVVRVVDGDTAVLRLDSGAVEKTRFIGIDTPESTNSREEYGEEAAAYTTRVLNPGRVVYLEQDVESRDRYGRLLAYVWLEPPADRSLAEVSAKMFNARLAAQGYAQQMTVPPNVTYADHFRRLVARARRARMGLWRESGQEPHL